MSDIDVRRGNVNTETETDRERQQLHKPATRSTHKKVVSTNQGERP
jgi:hypothetical protein